MRSLVKDQHNSCLFSDNTNTTCNIVECNAPAILLVLPILLLLASTRYPWSSNYAILQLWTCCLATKVWLQYPWFDVTICEVIEGVFVCGEITSMLTSVFSILTSGIVTNFWKGH